MMSPRYVADAAVSFLLKEKPVIYPGRTKLMTKIPRIILKKMVFKRISYYKEQEVK